MNINAIKPVLKVVLAYILFGGIYIIYSDRFVQTISQNHDMLTKLQTYKGWGFIILTALLLFYLLYRQFSKLEKEQKNLEQSELKWRSLVTNSPDFIALLDKEGKFLFVNKYPAGFTSEMIIGKNSIDYFSDEFKDRFKEILHKCIETKTTQKFEARAFGDNKSIRLYEEYLVPILDKNNNINLLAIARDITDKRIIQEELSKSELRFRKLIEHAPDGIALVGMDGKFNYLSPSAKSIFGYNIDDKIDIDPNDATHPEDITSVLNAFNNLIENPSLVLTLQYRFKNKDGSWQWIESTFTNLLNEPGIESFVINFHSIEKHKKNEVELAKKEKLYRTLFNLSPSGVMLEDTSGNILDFNETYLKTTGYLREELIGQNVSKIVPPEFQLDIERNISEIRKGKTLSYELSTLRKDGSRREIELRETMITLPNGENGIIVVTNDISERKQAEKDLLFAHTRLRRFVDSNIVGVIIATSSGKILEANDYYLNMIGYTRAELEAGKVDWRELTPQEWLFTDEKALVELKETGVCTPYEKEYQKRDGTRVAVYLADAMLPGDEETIAAFALNITDRKRVELELIESEARYRSLFENMSEGFAYCKMIYEDDNPVDFIYLKTNPKFSLLTGLKEVDGKRISDLVPGFSDSNPEIIKIYGRVALNGESEHFESFVELLNDWYSVSVYCPKKEYFVAVFDVITERKKNELDLIKNRRFLADLIENSGTLIFVKDLEGRYELVNKKWEAITSLNRKNVIGKTDDELFPGFDGIQYRKNDLEVMQSGKLIESEEILTNGGNTKYFISVKFPTLDEEGKINGICGVSTEITERKLAEKELKESEERFRSIVEGAPDAIFIQADGKFVFLNPAAYELFGYDSENGIVDTNVIDHIHTDYRLIAAERMKLLNSERKPVVDLKEQIFLKKDGSELWVETKGEPITYKGKHGALVFVRDISQRKKVEKTLRESEERYRTITENISDVVWILDVQSQKFTYISPSVYQQRGYTVEEIMEQPLSDALTSREKYKLNEFIGDRVKEFLTDPSKPTYFTDEVEQPRKDGSTIWTEIVTNYYVNEHTGRIEIRGVSRDVSERRKIQKAIKESEERYRTITEHISDVVWILDVVTERFTYVSPSVYNLRGYTPEEIMEKSVYDALIPEFAEMLKEITNQRIAEFINTNDSGKSYLDQVEQPCKDGSTVWTEVVTSFYKNETTGNINVRGVTRNISERKKIQDALTESEERFRSTLDNMLEGCQIIDSDWRYVYLNDSADIHNRRLKSELLGKRYMDVWPGIENTYVFSRIKNCIENRVPFQFENEFIYPDGKIGWFDLSIQPVPEGVFILSIDITDRKKAEQDILDSREHLRALTARLEKVREEERIHLSRELHDHLGQNLTGLKMDVAYIAKHLKPNQSIDKNNILNKTVGMVELIDSLIKNVRKISGELRPNVLDYLGLIPAIEWHIDEFKKRTEIECIFNSNTSKIDLGMEINSSVFRIIQEAFTNIIRHSKADRVIFNISDNGEYIIMQIQDNGIGIYSEEISNVKSLGILGMKERTLQFDGILQIDNVSEGGTLLTLIIPKPSNI